MIRPPKTGVSFRQALDATRRRPTTLNRLRQAFWFLFAMVLICGMPTSAQVRSNIAGVNLTANLGDSISVSASPGLVNFALVSNGVATGNPTLTITTAWLLGQGKPRTVSTSAYFTNSASALSDGGGHNIPASSVSASVNGGAFQTFTGACTFSANACLPVPIFSKLVNGPPNQRKGTDNSTLQLQISTVGLSLPAGTYVGVLHIQAQAI